MRGHREKRESRPYGGQTQPKGGSKNVITEMRDRATTRNVSRKR